MPDEILRLDDVVKRFGNITAVDGLSLSVNEGEMLSIIGPNGAGKTTTFNLITGKFTPTSGSIHFQDTAIDGMKPHEIVEHGLVRSFQISQLFTGLTVLENIRLATQASKTGFGLTDFTQHYTDQEEALEEAYEVLDRIDMADVATQTADSLSHGQQRRLEIGIALARDPDVFCLDEPTAGMHPGETGEMMDLIADVSEDTTIILIEHDMNVVMEISDRVAVMNQGSLIALNTPEDTKKNRKVQEVYLGETAI